MQLFGPPCVFVMILHTCASHLCGNVTSAGWQVRLCDPIWHVSSRSGVATLQTAIHLLLTYLSLGRRLEVRERWSSRAERWR